MKWSLIKSWAKDHGYTSFREKTDRVDNPNEYDYYWGKTDDPSVSGCAISVSKLAMDIYNHITDNKFIEHQERYRQQKAIEDINRDGLSEGW